MLQSFITVKLEENKLAQYTELSFYEYKSIIKMLMSNEYRDINKGLDLILKSKVTCDKPLNVIDKLKIFLSMRGIALGNEIEFIKDKKRITYNLNKISDLIPSEELIKFDNFYFGAPENFYYDKPSMLLASCFKKYKDKRVDDLSYEDRVKILDETDLPLIDVYKQLIEIFQEKNIPILDDLFINIYFHESTLPFLRGIFSENLQDVLNFEYVCITNLNLSSEDFKTYSYPELKIFLNFLQKERKEESEKSNSGNKL